ncbi:MAG: lytic murein transglycosylase [Actinomycetota bacterium]|nr:lytic murein transglycosylase [Actinomycetota bacterium]
MFAFIATFLVLLVFGLVAGNPSAKSAEQDVAASALTQERANEMANATAPEVPPTNPPSTVPTAPPPTGDGSSAGGTVPAPGPGPGRDDAISGGSDGGGNSKNSGGSSKGPREPDFVEQDPGLSDGVVSPDDIKPDPFELDRLNVPNFVINNFEIPPFLLPIYQACGSEYGIPWEVLASINRAETTFGTNLGDSTAGAMGWMMFMPASWAEWGVDANGDKIKDPYNPVDAICAAGNYLEYFGYAEDPYKAIFAYNHADWYVQLILKYAKIYSAIPPEMISALTGLTEGARFPIAAESSYEGEISTEAAKKNGTASQDVSASADRTAISIQAQGGAPVIAVNDGKITSIDSDTGTVVLEDVYGNRYSYAGLGSIASVHPVPQHEGSDNTPPSVEDAPARTRDVDPALEMGTAKAAAKPSPGTAKAKAQVKPEASVSDEEISEVLVDPDAAARAAADQAAGVITEDSPEEPVDVAAERRAEQERLSARSEATTKMMNTENMRGRTYASPLRPSNQNRSTIQGQSTEATATAVAMSGGVEGKPGDYLIYDGSKAGVYKFKPGTAILKPLRKGSQVIAGTVLGRLSEQSSSSLTFSIQPGGEDTPQIDPKPFLDGWRLLAETNIYNAQGKNRFADRLGIGGVLLLSKSALQRRILADENISLGECDRQYIAGGAIDRRLLAALAFASEKNYELLITSMYCGREGSITTSGNTSNHSSARAADIAAINGEVVTSATQGPGSLTDRLAREFLALQGIMAPDEVITLLDYPQPAGFAMGDHDDHLHLGYSASGDSDVPGGSVQSTLGAEQWARLTQRLGQITNPEVPTAPSDDALPAEKSDRGN